MSQQVFRLHWNPEEAGLLLVKERLSNRAEELAREGEGKQTKSKRFLIHVLLCVMAFHLYFNK